MKSVAAHGGGMRPLQRRGLLDAPARTRGVQLWLWAALGAGSLHAALLGAALAAGTRRSQGRPPPTPPALEVSLTRAAPPEPPPTAPVSDPPAPPPPAAPPAPRRARAAPTPAPERPPPSAAESGKLPASESVDFGDGFVVGSGTTYAGGVSAQAGTSRQAVSDSRARPGSGAPGGRASAARPPGLASGLSWECPFPVEAEDAGVDRALVGLRVEVAADGQVREVQALTDPGLGFAREARRCALHKRWTAALSASGAPIAGVALVEVRFER